MELWYRAQREQVWSPWLGTSLRSLGQRFPDDLEIDVEDADPPNGGGDDTDG
jgi:hypothetical protein